LSPPAHLPNHHVWVSNKTADTLGKPKMIVNMFEQLMNKDVVIKK